VRTLPVSHIRGEVAAQGQRSDSERPRPQRDLGPEPIALSLIPEIAYSAVSVRVIVAAEVSELVVAETYAKAGRRADLVRPRRLHKVMRIPDVGVGIPKNRFIQPERRGHAAIGEVGHEIPVSEG